MRLDIHLFNPELFNQAVEPNYAHFLAAPIMLDTHNFCESYRNKKWSEEDLEQVTWLRKFTHFSKLDTAFFDKY